MSIYPDNRMRISVIHDLYRKILKERRPIVSYQRLDENVSVRIQIRFKPMAYGDGAVAFMLTPEVEDG